MRLERFTKTTLALAAITFAAALLRFSLLGHQSFWLDETATGRLMRMGFWSMTRQIGRSESTPPLYYVLLWPWAKVFGVSEVGLRSFSALIGTLTTPLMYVTAKRWLDQRAGLALAVLATCNPLLVWYSQEARSYMLFLALCTASVWALHDALAAAPERKVLWRWGVIAALALATHYFALFVLLPQGVLLAWRRRWLALSAPVVIGVALAPLALTQQAHGTAHFISDSPLSTRILQVPKQLLIGYATPGQTVLIAVAGVCALGALFLGWRASDASTRRLAYWLALGALISVLVPLLAAIGGFDYLITRNVLGTWSIAVLAGVLLVSRGDVWAWLLLGGVCAAGVVAVIAVAGNPAYQRDDWRGVAALVPKHGLSALVVSPSSGRLPLEYYLPQATVVGPDGVRVSEIVSVSLALRKSGGGGTVTTPILLQPPPAGFASPVLTHHATFVVATYKALHGSASVSSFHLLRVDLVPGSPTSLAISR